jgi:hypothetical protein
VDYAGIAAAILGAVFFYKGAEQEHRSPVVWVGLSVLASGVLMFGLHKGFWWILLAQFVLAIAIALWRMWRETPAGDAKDVNNS